MTHTNKTSQRGREPDKNLETDRAVSTSETIGASNHGDGPDNVQYRTDNTYQQYKPMGMEGGRKCITQNIRRT